MSATIVRSQALAGRLRCVVRVLGILTRRFERDSLEKAGPNAVYSVVVVPGLSIREFVAGVFTKKTGAPG